MRRRAAAQRPDTAELDALKAGRPNAWRQILSRHGPALLNYAARMLGDRGCAEEIVQDALVNIYQAIDGFEGRCSLKSWLYRAVHNKAIDEIRRRKRYVDAGPDIVEKYFNEAGRWQHDCPGWDGLVAQKLDQKRLLQSVHEQMDRLPHAYREVLLMKEVDGLETAEICDVLEITPGNLRIRIHRARTALRAAVVGE